MKFLVDTLPYYGENCPFSKYFNRDTFCYGSVITCPRYWDKHKICSDENPHECELLKEVDMDALNQALNDRRSE
jgi:hypothetical protein